MKLGKSIFIVLFAVVLTSCSEYQKALKSEEVEPKYKVGNELYKKGLEVDKNKYLKRSIRLFEQILPQYQGKPQGQLIAFKIANAYYIIGDNIIASYKFKRFVNSYPDSPKFEEAFFKSAKSLYELSPRYSKDQSETTKAINKLQAYVNKFQNGQYYEEANELLSQLQFKLEKKRYEIAKQYHHREIYKAAIESFDNFLIEFPGTTLKDKALFYKFESAYLLAINSVPSKVKSRLKEAKAIYEKYIETIENPAFKDEANKYNRKIEAYLIPNKIKNKNS
ncbi:MAG: outer membrane protein assembly factor BamD [Psychroflexus sp.]|jgi:outer membrane protein assembly factor BamD|nr:outer membrane protein assembly factor BamD [Psychroflexus sp.]MDR9448542.1 outer membrane protein assembly factor BamD [Psychroflexus sp.]